MDIEWIKERFNITYECRFCGQQVHEDNLEEHQNECEE